ncbi:MAG: hypothetical protein ACUVWN_16265 [bacterium]
MMRGSLIILLFIVLSLALVTGNSTAKTLFYDNFDDGKIADVWKFSGKDIPQTHKGTPEWFEKNGVFSQVNEKQGDEAHAVIMQDFPELITIQAKVRLDSWANGDSARAGLGLRVGKATGRGYNFLFHNTQSTIQFLNDQSAWGNSGAYEFKVGEWYWMQFHISEDNVLHGKVWKDGEKEPAKWMLEQPAFGETRPWKDGYPSLNGGTSPHGGSCTVSFDEAEVWDEDGPTPKAVSYVGKIAFTWAGIKSER